ncbi:hypothetical protein LTR86_011185, partial [Recurvomyces mirabilis]
ALDSAFRASEWVNRCWTLQELLAPEDLLFVTHSWSPFLRFVKSRTLDRGGACKYLDRSQGYINALDSLVNASRVPNDVLLRGRHGLRNACIAEKMHWAAHRQATRAEDVAYSLLGLFEINMPLLYGEGDRAFMRLQHEIIRQVSDETIFAWQAPRCGTSPYYHAQTKLIQASHPSAFIDSARTSRSRIDDDRTILVPMHQSISRERETPFQLTNRGLLMIVVPRIITKQWNGSGE